jgi:hypothetical protein
VSKPNNHNPLALILKEAEGYNSVEKLEMLVDQKSDLSPLPIQPLYSALKSFDHDKMALTLSKLSKRQRQAFLDIDLWQKDDLDVDEFSQWLKVYSLCPDENIRREFVKAPEFLLYLKSRFNIWTFDVEEPEYPDHDNYFLTDDQLLLVEFDENFEFVGELRQLIRELYSEMGVEYAYSYLFKLVTDSFLIAQEEEYKNKKHRLAEYGMIDYFDALELDAPLPSESHIRPYIKKKLTAKTPNLQMISQGQTLPSSSLVAYKDNLDELSGELSKLIDQKRLDYLHFNFIRTVNASVSAQNALKEGRVALTRIGHTSRIYLLLGLSYLKEFLSEQENEEMRPQQGIFEYYDFLDLYKIGSTLIKSQLSLLKKNLQSYALEDEREAFMGKTWVDFLDDSFTAPLRYNKNPADHAKGEEVSKVEIYREWKTKVEECLDFIPFIASFYFNYDKLLEEGRVQDHFYLNYGVSDIDFEAIIISSYANYLIGSYDPSHNPEGVPKMGMTIPEFKSFVSQIINPQTGEIFELSKLAKSIKEFKKHFKISGVEGFEKYLHTVMKSQLDGYDYQNLKIEDFKHVGGPILLKLN